MSESCTSATEERMVRLRSSVTFTSIDGEMVLANAGRSAFTRSMVSMMFAPGCLRMMSSTARAPSAHAATRRFSTSSVTLRHVAEPHRRAVLVGDNERAEAVRAEDLIVRRWRASASRRPPSPWADRWSRARWRCGRPRGRGPIPRARRGPPRRARQAAGRRDEHLPDAVHLRDLLREDGVRRVEDLPSGSVCEVSETIMIGASAGFTLR